MNLDELRSVQSKERQKDSLQNLRPSFYQEVGEYIADLEAERDQVAERADDPFSSPEVSRLTDEIETAKDVVEAIYERRMGKLVKQASLAAAGMAADDEGLTAEEADLFADLVDRIESNKGRVLDVLEEAQVDTDTEKPRSVDSTRPSSELSTDVSSARPEDDAPPAPPQEPPEPALESEDAPDPAGGVSAADVMGGEPDPIDDVADSDGETDETESRQESDGSIDDADVDRVTVRITRDVGPILGVDDREYTLSTDDIVTLPEQNADPLVEQEAAEPLE
ncbi:hypothetical protein [Natronobacterium gregoryi]|uniref:Uncharacterized protein n=2 Tax=Natronobacterium gregoryi TaxID=44930 RepID=L0ALZ4_NATGS|nr:hypothetical protein [Natronobacterium gregoryi]AFZ74816.1 hypothetical protein Natgr_3710 [Natronobacterium gregoryi SP2]ELY66149.1 hypothetical protein C490_13334 [Natronobacterium gregoryi SP2]PLK19476.1 hypothetical protein CYV19_14545 [Natronobacterium gregoryi SP2]SFJ43640.1 DNA replication factor GINS [Natronobacterium gregoryi]